MRLEDLDDGSRLEASWNEALNSSLAYFRALLASSSSSSWKSVKVLPLTSSSIARDDGQSSSKGSSIGRISAGDVKVSRRTGKTGEVFRAVVDLECGGDVSVDTFRGCLATPETRPTWDRMVEEAETLELLDAHTRVTQTKYRLGWPSSPRDTITLGKTLVDQRTLIDISTSLPRSKHEPTYLRAAPPYVRAHVSLLAWCIQLPGSSTEILEGKARITCFWSWNPKGTWAAGGGVPQHLPSVMVGLVDQVREGSEKVPVLLGYGPDVAIGPVSYDSSRVTLSVGYAIIRGGENVETEGMRRQLEFGVSSTQSWDVQIHVKTQHGEESPSTLWTSFVGQAPSYAGVAPKRLILRFAHAMLTSSEEMVRVKVSIERTSSATSGVRINGIPVTIESMEPDHPRRPLLEETASTSGLSLRTFSTVDAMSTLDSVPQQGMSERARSTKSQAIEKGIASLVKRNYIYFTSLLQEPEPKWRPVLDSRGVAIHQLNSIDKTLVVFRAEAVFVGVGIWDLFATIASPSARMVWDKSHDEATLLEDVNELTDLWHFKSRAAWPVSARDSVMLRTTYKSPSSVHIFGFSVDDHDLFKRIPPIIDPTVIRTQIDLQGWSIESLSPNTTHVALVEQSDPRGWSNKSSIPQVMMSTLAGIGEFAIKHGSPPITTRLGGAKAISTRYDVEKETFRYEYENAEARRSGSSSTATAFPLPVAVRGVDADNDVASLKSLEVKHSITNIECEIRCDADRWTNNFVVTIDPPQTAISALKRHRLSAGGGGLWLTIEHDPATLGTEKIVVFVRKGPSVPGAKVSLTVNGNKVKVDSEDLPETNAHLLKSQKRSRPSRAPLDQPAALGTLRRKQSEMSVARSASESFGTSSKYSRIAMPLSRLYSFAADTTRAAIVPMSTTSTQTGNTSTPVDAVVRALGQVSRIHADRDGESTDPNGWQPVSERDGFKIEKRLLSHVSDTFPVYRAGRIIEGFTAEEVSSAITSLGKDEQFEAPVCLQSYGHGISISQMTAFTTFPFRSRSMVVVNVVARMADGPPPSPSIAGHSSLSTIFHASTSSFDIASLNADPAKYNPAGLPSGNIILEGWIIETIDPYSHEQYAIPSARCVYVGAADYSGNIPQSVNNMLNSCLPRSLISVESTLRNNGPSSCLRTPSNIIMMPDAISRGPWSLDYIEDKVMVDERVSKEDYSTTIVISPLSTQRNGNLSPPLRHNDSRTSVNSTRSTVVDLGEEIRRGKQDLVVVEVNIGRSMGNRGCEISIQAVSLPIATGPETDTLSFELPEQQIELPFKVSVIALAPSALQSASLDTASPPRHLLRVTLPTSGYEAPVNDPLTGKSGPLPRPRWLLDLLNDGLVVQLKLKARSSTSKVPLYFVDDLEIPVEEEKRGRVFSRDARSRLPQLVNRSTPSSTSLENPRAVARNFARDVIPSSIPEPPVESPEASIISSPPTLAEPPVAEPVTKSPLPSSISGAQPSRYSFWRYPYPRLGRTSTSAPASEAPGPIENSATSSSQIKSPLTDKVKVHHDATSNSTPVPPGSAPGSDLTLSISSAQSPSPTYITSSQITSQLQPLLTPLGLFICCILSLLLGSLLRSFLSEADFVIHLPAGSSATHMTDGKAEIWRELRRLAEWRIGWDRYLIIAVARR